MEDVGDYLSKIPRYTYDLVEYLDQVVPEVSLDGLPVSEWQQMDEGRVRALAYMAGRRSLVDELVGWREEENADASEESGTPEPRVAGEAQGFHQ
jgi:hypothetical protein